jgi:hypothetical protein
MQQLLGGWRLYLRAGTIGLAELVDAGVSLRQTVVWLDDLHDLLDAGTEQAGGWRLTADLVRRLLAPDAGPVIIIATTWPDKRDLYSASPPAPREADLRADARKILDMAEQIDLDRSSARPNGIERSRWPQQTHGWPRRPAPGIAERWPRHWPAAAN